MKPRDLPGIHAGSKAVSEGHPGPQESEQEACWSEIPPLMSRTNLYLLSLYEPASSGPAGKESPAQEISPIHPDGEDLSREGNGHHPVFSVWRTMDYTIQGCKRVDTEPD